MGALAAIFQGPGGKKICFTYIAAKKPRSAGRGGERRAGGMAGGGRPRGGRRNLRNAGRVSKLSVGQTPLSRAPPRKGCQMGGRKLGEKSEGAYRRASHCEGGGGLPWGRGGGGNRPLPPFHVFGPHGDLSGKVGREALPADLGVQWRSATRLKVPCFGPGSQSLPMGRFVSCRRFRERQGPGDGRPTRNAHRCDDDGPEAFLSLLRNCGPTGGTTSGGAGNWVRHRVRKDAGMIPRFLGPPRGRRLPSARESGAWKNELHWYFRSTTGPPGGPARLFGPLTRRAGGGGGNPDQPGPRTGNTVLWRRAPAPQLGFNVSFKGAIRGWAGFGSRESSGKKIEGGGAHSASGPVCEFRGPACGQKNTIFWPRSSGEGGGMGAGGLGEHT